MALEISSETVRVAIIITLFLVAAAITVIILTGSENAIIPLSDKLRF